MEVKSLHHHPSPGLTLKEPGFYDISGVAYSGTGRIAKVLVSADGGKSWGEAALQGPVPTRRSPASACRGAGTASRRCCKAAPGTRPATCSRPRAEFVGDARRGGQPVTTPLGFPDQHFNSITSWAVDGKGEINHVYA